MKSSPTKINGKRLALSITLATTLVLTGCVSAPTASPTPYKSASTKQGYGYSSEKISKNQYRIQFKATDKTPADKVQQFTLYRAAEIAQSEGFSHLSIVRTNVVRKPVIAREIVNRDKPTVSLPSNQQCTMSGCEEVAQPMAASTTNDVITKQINDIYFSIIVDMANSENAFTKSVFSVNEVLASPLKQK